MATNNKPSPPQPAPADCSDVVVWCARFRTRDRKFHPVWWGRTDGPPIEKRGVEAAAKAYLAANSTWLKSIDEIYPSHRLNSTLSEPSS